MLLPIPSTSSYVGESCTLYNNSKDILDCDRDLQLIFIPYSVGILFRIRRVGEYVCCDSVTAPEVISVRRQK